MRFKQLRQIQAALARLAEDPQPITVQSGKLELYGVVAAVQLASRHPGATGPTMAGAIQWAHQVGDALSADDPVLRQFIAMGWQPQMDVAADVEVTADEEAPPLVLLLPDSAPAAPEPTSPRPGSPSEGGEGVGR